MQENFELVQRGFRILVASMSGYVGQELNKAYKGRWWEEVLDALSDQRDLPERGTYGELVDSLDIANCIRLLDRKWLFLLDTFLIWGGYFCYFYITFYAFGFTEDLGVVVGLIAFTMSSIGVAVPVQGGIGPWHFMVIATLVCFGVNENDAAAFALVVHTVQTVWTGLCGLFGIVAIPLNNRKTAVQPS